MEFLDMPRHMVGQVLEWLDVRSLVACACTCRALRAVCREDEWVWASVVLRSYATTTAPLRTDVLARERSWRRIALRRFKYGSFFDDIAAAVASVRASSSSSPSAHTSAATAAAYRGAAGDAARRAAWDAARVAFRGLLRVVDFLPRAELHLARVLAVPVPSAESLLDFAEIGEMALLFDYAKMTAPHVQNELPFLHRFAAHYNMPEDERAHFSTLMIFIARPAPVLGHLRAWIQARPTTATAAALVAVANAFLARVERKTTPAKEEVGELPSLMVRGLTFAVLLYDAVTAEDAGAFSARCPIAMRRCVAVLRAHPDARDPPLLNFLRYTTDHFAERNSLSRGTDATLLRAIFDDP
jgi:hypothetical protein